MYDGKIKQKIYYIEMKPMKKSRNKMNQTDNFVFRCRIYMQIKRYIVFDKRKSFVACVAKIIHSNRIWRHTHIIRTLNNTQYSFGEHKLIDDIVWFLVN